MEYIVKTKHDEAHALIGGFLQRHKDSMEGLIKVICMSIWEQTLFSVSLRPVRL